MGDEVGGLWFGGIERGSGRGHPGFREEGFTWREWESKVVHWGSERGVVRRVQVYLILECVERRCASLIGRSSTVNLTSVLALGGRRGVGIGYTLN